MMANFNNHLLPILNAQLTEQEERFNEEIFNKLSQEQQDKIFRYLCHAAGICISALANSRYTANDGGEERGRAPFVEDNKIQACATLLSNELKSNFTPLEQRIAAVKLISVNRFVLMMIHRKYITEERYDQLSEKRKLLLQENEFKASLSLSNLIENVAGQLEPYQKQSKTRRRKTEEKWRPWREEFYGLLARGRSPDVARKKVGDMIEAAINAHPKTTMFKKRPSRISLIRHLVPK